MLTAAVRDLHRCHPRRFVTDVRTSCPALWEHNPNLTPLREGRGVRLLDCHYPLIHHSNQRPVHFLLGFVEDLNEQLGTRIQTTTFKGDVYLSAAEKTRPSPIATLTGSDLPYWIIVAGGKFDYTIKWWHFRRFQRVVDHFVDRIQFVQVGETGHHHPPLGGVIDLRGRTSLREMVLMMHHAQGVLCPVTFLMHLAAAVETRPGRPPQRPCVVVAGGREPPHWESYPHHQFLHTVGALPCCATGGCWKARIVPLGDGDEKDGPKHLCVDVVNGLPRCMDMITPEDVVRRIEWHFEAGVAKYLTAAQARRARPHRRASERELLLGSGPLA
jgi:ADP-heptose:LPS heptosyltransferase